jgi:NAD(P)-dependent dehydrogenase (short-subunit alcohol dehydrogenase family)/acyl carrier protein
MAQARHVGRIVVRHGGPPPASVRADGTYLVTGGLSGLGPAVAEWLVARGAGKVVLVSRRGVTPAVSDLLAPLRDRGSAIVAESVDVTDEAALGALLDRLRREGPPLRGVVHGAGVLADASLLQQDAAKLAAACAPKVRGGWLLDRLTRGDALDWFVLFSSAASVVGAPGQANYAAANAFLDVLARERRTRGLPGLSVNWGGWSEVGMAAERGTLERLAAQGMGALTPEQGRKALERTIDDGLAQVAVVPGDWRRYAAQTGGGRVPPVLAELLGEPGARPAHGQEASRAAAPAAVDLRAQLGGVPQGRWKPTVAAFVRERALGALGMAPDRPVDPSAPLGELGLDSLLAVELRNTLSAALGRPMPATLLFDCPTIDALTGYILRETLGVREDGADAPPPSAIPKVANAADLVGAIEELSDEEVERQLGALAGSNAG